MVIEEISPHDLYGWELASRFLPFKIKLITKGHRIGIGLTSPLLPFPFEPLTWPLLKKKLEISSSLPTTMVVRASTIESSQLAIRSKIVSAAGCSTFSSAAN
jgi:hypothetical protein